MQSILHKVQATRVVNTSCLQCFTFKNDNRSIVSLYIKDVRPILCLSVQLLYHSKDAKCRQAHVHFLFVNKVIHLFYTNKKKKWMIKIIASNVIEIQNVNSMMQVDTVYLHKYYTVRVDVFVYQIYLLTIKNLFISKQMQNN